MIILTSNEAKLNLFNKAFNEVLENLSITEDELNLSNQDNFVSSFKTRLIEKIDQENLIEILTTPIKEWLDKITAHTLKQDILEQGVKETVEETYQQIIEQIQKLKLPPEIIKTWEEEKNKHQQEKQKPITNPKLYLNSPITPIPTAALMMSSINSQIKKENWQKDNNNLAFFEHIGKKPNQIIEHYISQSSSEGDISILPWEEAQQIIEKFSFITAKLHLLFAAHCMKQEKPWESQFTLKASDIIQEIGWDKRTDIPKHQLLKEIASAAYTLDCLTVRAEWETGRPKKGKIPIMVNISRLWTVSFKYYGQRDLLTNKIEEANEVYITIRPGIWTESFLNSGGASAKKALYQFGYMAQEVFKIDPYHDELALRLAIHLTLESRYHKSGKYKVETLLRNVLLGAEAKIKKAREDYRYAHKFKNQWNNALILLEKLRWQITYDSETYPSNIQPHSQEKYPIGYFDKILGATLTILPPAPIPIILNSINITETKQLKTKEQPQKKLSPLNINDIKKARKAKKWTQKQLADFMGVSQQLISFIENGCYIPNEKQEKSLRNLLEI